MGCGCKGSKAGQTTKYEVRTNQNGTKIVDDMSAVRRALALGGGGTWKAITVNKP